MEIGVALGVGVGIVFSVVVAVDHAILGAETGTVADWCRGHRHEPVQEQHTALTRRIAGHFNYFGVNGNVPCLRHVLRACAKVWHKWLNRRSQRASKTWDEFNDLLQRYPLPRASVRVQLW